MREKAVPRFYFDVREGGRFMPDETGIELDSLDAAEHEATRGAADIGRDQLLKGDACNVIIEVRDEQGQQVVTARILMEVRRRESAPRA